MIFVESANIQVLRLRCLIFIIFEPKNFRKLLLLKRNMVFGRCHMYYIVDWKKTVIYGF